MNCVLCGKKMSKPETYEEVGSIEFAHSECKEKADEKLRRGEEARKTS